MFRTICKVIGIYCIAFVIVVSIAYIVVTFFNVGDGVPKVLVGYLCGVIGSIPAVIISEGFIYRYLSAKGE